MKPPTLVITSLCLLVAAAPAAAEPPGGRRAEAPENYEIHRDLEFAKPGGVSLKLDAHIPPGKGPFPTVILVHGGGWTGGHKTAEFIQPLFEPLTKGGFAWFTISYRLAPKYPYPAAVEDVEEAIEYVRRQAKRFKVDKKRIALMGESAGAHLVNLAGLRNPLRPPLAAVVSFYGPFDMVMFSRKYEGKKIGKNFAGFFKLTTLDAEALATLHEASPLTYARKDGPKFLLIHGTEDEAVPYEQSTYFQAYMKRLGVRCDLITVQDGLHGIIRWEKDVRFQGYKSGMVDWLHANLGPGR